MQNHRVFILLVLNVEIFRTVGVQNTIRKAVGDGVRVNRDGIELGNSLGYAVVSDHNNDGNGALKMTKKRSYIDAVLRVTGTSTIFTQDYGESADHVTRNQLS